MDIEFVDSNGSILTIKDSLDKMRNSVSFHDPLLKEKLCKIYKRDGVVVITNVFNEKECNSHMDDIISYFEQLGSGINRANIKETWTAYNCPPQTRSGLFQCLVSNMPVVWTIRSNAKIRKIFEIIYSDLRNKPITDFIVSNDGINIKPGSIGPYYESDEKDWPHMDQTDRSDKWKCVQGQAVLTNTTAAFRASLGSHCIFEKVLDLCDVDEKDKTNWCKFNPQQISAVKNLVEDRDENITWQKLIHAPKGSFILWSSSTIHSAKLQDGPCEPSDDEWKGWRGVVYVCYRPKEEFTKLQLSKRAKIVEENRTTNHWGTKMFPKKPGYWRSQIEHHPAIEEMLKEPKIVYKNNPPQLTQEQKLLIC